MVPASDLVHRLLNILVRRLCFLRVHYIDIMVLEYGTRISLHLIGIKYENQRHLPESLVIA